jgi:hypothetical protein
LKTKKSKKSPTFTPCLKTKINRHTHTPNPNRRYKLNITLPLIETVSWEEVSKKIGFNNFKRIALGVGIRGTLQD